jgi:hypothetical protein
MKGFEGLTLLDRLKGKVYAYYKTIWREKWQPDIEQKWLSNFVNGDEDEEQKERINMLYLLTKFMYFGNAELRELLLSLFRDLYKYPIVHAIRKENNDTTDINLINTAFKSVLESTRFLGVGNPSESGVHMLYYFRQEAELSKEQFLNTGEIFKTEAITGHDGAGIKVTLTSEITDPKIRRYIFIDDFCGSGSQAKGYLSYTVKSLKAKDPDLIVCYYMLFATEDGIKVVRDLGIFDQVEAVYIIDRSFKTFSEGSRYFAKEIDPLIEKEYSKAVATRYGQKLLNSAALGYGDCQLLLGFFHNTPDNSLPVFWSEENSWKPIFKRYQKLY